MKKFVLTTTTKNSKQKSSKKINKFQLIDSNLENYINIVKNSKFYDSTFDDPINQKIDFGSINFRICEDFRNYWINLISNRDPKIKRIKQKGTFLVIHCKGGISKKNDRFVIFQCEKEVKVDEDKNKKETSKKISKKRHKHIVKNKRRGKNKNSRKGRRK